MRTVNVLRACALAILLPSVLAACGDDTGLGGGGSGEGGGGGTDPTTTSVTSTGAGGDGGTPTTGGGGEGGVGGGELNDTCDTASPLEVGVDEEFVVQGTITNAADDYQTFCADNSPNESSNDLLYEITTTDDCSLTLILDGDFNGVLSFRPACESDDGFCFNTSMTNEETARFHAAAGVYYIMVSDLDNAGGDFELSIGCGGPVCGDGVIGPLEDCDFGDTLPGDGCDASCLFEPNDPSIDTCAGAEGTVGTPILLNTSITIPANGERSTIGAIDSGTGTCMYDPAMVGAEPSGDHIYRIIPAANGQLTLRLGNDDTGVAACKDANGDPAVDAPAGLEPPGPPWDIGCYDRTIHVRTDCDAVATEVACTDSSQTTGGWWNVETVTFAVTAGTSYYVFVDGWANYNDGSDIGEYVLEASLAP